MTPFKRPMLACPLLETGVESTNENIYAAMRKLRYPVVCSLKKDGIRAIRLDGSLLSRTLKPIPNKFIRERSLILPGGFDMELWTPHLRYDEIESIVMSAEHEDSQRIEFHVLDWFRPEGFHLRIQHAHRWLVENMLDERGAIPVFSPDLDIVTNAEQLMQRFLDSEDCGAEGICFRTLNGPYKQGRSTLNEQYLVKLCRYHRTEVKIVGFVEQMMNINGSRRNAVGAMDRAKCQDNLVPKDTLGALECIMSDGQVVSVGTGFTDKLRKEIWNRKEQYVGRTITIKHKPHGAKDKPRSPVFVGFRDTTMS